MGIIFLLRLDGFWEFLGGVSQGKDEGDKGNEVKLNNFCF